MTSETAAQSGDFSTDFVAAFAASEADWLKAAEAALKGRPLDPVIRGRTIDGAPFDAIRPRVEARPLPGRPAGRRWTAMARIDLPDPEEANAQALEDLNNGSSGLSLVLAHRDGETGLLADTLERLATALDGVLLDLAPVHVDAPHLDERTTAALLAALVERRGLDPAAVSILFGFDLIRDLTQTPSATSWERRGSRAAGAVSALLERGFGAPILMIDQRPAHDAGASEAQELAGALACAVEHIRVLGDNGLDAGSVADATAFAFSCDADQFAGIAKLRAARLLWAAVRRELGLDERPVHIHAQTSRRMLTRKDAHTNMVRSTIAAFAAGVGGADSVVVLPHTLALGGSDADARRIARNTQSMVLEETNAYRVADPAAGAGAIEALTDTLAERAWALFRDIEREGGMYAAVSTGRWQRSIAETQSEREKRVAARKSPIVGVSEFPKADEAPIDLPAPNRPAAAPRGAGLSGLGDDAESFGRIVAAFRDGASVADVETGSEPADASAVERFEVRRTAEPFERLREANEARADRPKAFLALLGPLPSHSGRAGFIRNLLGAGGVAPIDGPVGATDEDAVAAFAASGAPLAILCGADADYAESGAALGKALAGAGATVWLAGRPKEGREALEQAGVTRFVAAGDDVLDILRQASELGAKPSAQGGAS